MNKFLFQQYKTNSLEQTRDTEELGRCLLLEYNADETVAKTKLRKVFRQLQKSSPLETIGASSSKFKKFPEIVDGIARDTTLQDKATRLRLLLDQSPRKAPQVQPTAPPKQQFHFYGVPTTPNVTINIPTPT